MLKRPVFSEVPGKGEDKTINYIFAANVYMSELESAVKKLRLGLLYAMDVMEADIPGFERLIQDTYIGKNIPDEQEASLAYLQTKNFAAEVDE